MEEAPVLGLASEGGSDSTAATPPCTSGVRGVVDATRSYRRDHTQRDHAG